MKSLNRYLVITALAAPLLLTACADHDVYDPDKVRPVPPAENPLGDDFVAPDGFDWSLITTVKLNIEVKDELNGQYNYLAEVFTTNPLTNTTATPIAAGYAKEGNNFVVEVSIPKTTERIFIRQTDPKQRKEIYEFAVPKNGGALTCKLYYTGGSTTRATTGSTSAFEAAKAAGIKELEDKNYTEVTPEIPAVPDKSDDPVGPYDRNKFNDGARIVIPAGEVDNTVYQMASGKGTIFVKGTWKVTNLYSNFDIYVLSGGKIEFALTTDKTFTTISKFVVEKGGTVESISNFSINYGDWFIGGDFIAHKDVRIEASVSSMVIASGATMSVNNGTLKPCSQVVKNFGTITAANITGSIDSYTEIYNAGTIRVADTMDLIRRNFVNKGDLTVGQWFKIDNTNALNKGQISTLNFEIVSSTFSNYGVVLLDEQAGIFKTNNTAGNINSITNHDKGIIKGYHLNGGVSVYNDGFIEFTLFENSSVDMLYNSCTLIVKERLNWINIVLDNGSITGERPANIDPSKDNASLWKPVPEISSSSPLNYTFKNGSMIKASLLRINKTPSNFQGEGSNPSLLQIEAVYIAQGGDTNLKNLIIEMPENAFTYAPGYNGVNNAKWITTGCSTTGWGESKYAFSTCGGYYNPGNGGGEPEDPPKPNVGDDTVYTYAFEDQWPAYGDFDMNDIVVSIDKMVTSNEGKTLSIKGHIRAVGSSRKTGVGIQFLNVSKSGVTLSGNVQSGTPVFEANQNNPVIILCTNAHKYCNPTIADDDYSFYNTVPTADSKYLGDGAEFEVVMAFPTADAAQTAMNVANLDVFIISKEPQGNVGRTEVHMAYYAPTNLGTTALFGMSNDASAPNDMLNVARKGYYVSTEGLAWGICIPNAELWKWPKEYMAITNVYPGFKDWVVNGGQAEDLDWISNHTNDVFVRP